MQGEGSSSQDEERIHQAEQARDKALAEAQYLWESLEEEKRQNTMAFQCVQRCHAMEIKNLTLQTKLKAEGITIEELKKCRNDYGDKIMRL